MRDWIRRTAQIQGELASLADVERRWWLLAGGVAAAEPWAPDDVYLACDCEPDADTLMAYPRTAARDVVTDAIARARAARTAIRELHGTLPDQPLAVTVEREPTRTPASTLEVAAFAVGMRCLVARLDDDRLPQQLARFIAGEASPPTTPDVPFVCVSLGHEPLETARHGHRRAWTERGGPWLGLGHTGALAVVSTSHLVVDGYGHAALTARIAELTAVGGLGDAIELPLLATPDGAVPLGVAWRELDAPAPRVLPLAYALGQILHRKRGAPPDAAFSPTIQIPVARGAKDDPLRLKRRVVAASTSVRFSDGQPEPYAQFAERTRAIIIREAAAAGLVSRLLAAARAVPMPLAWKRRSISAKRPRWLERLADVIGGRALLSRITIDRAMPPTLAMSSPSRLATAEDPIGGCVITLVDDGTRGAITVCGSGIAGTPARAEALLDELLARGSVPELG